MWTLNSTIKLSYSPYVQIFEIYLEDDHDPDVLSIIDQF